MNKEKVMKWFARIGGIILVLLFFEEVIWFWRDKTFYFGTGLLYYLGFVLVQYIEFGIGATALLYYGFRKS